MQRIRKYFSLGLLSLLFFSLTNCESIDDPEYDLIYPGSYYPCFPNSWWKYEVNDTTIITSSASNYELHSYLLDPGTASTPPNLEKFSEPTYVPVVDGVHIYGYKKIQWGSECHHCSNGFYLERFMSEEVGTIFRRGFKDTFWGDFGEYVEVVYKGFDGMYEVIKLEGGWGDYGPNHRNRTYEVFQKNVGMTSKITVDTLTNDTVYKAILIDYYIAD